MQKSEYKFFAGYVIYDKEDTEYKKATEIFSNPQSKKWKKEKYIDKKQNKAIASFLGNAIGDALGVHTEFNIFQIDDYSKKSNIQNDQYVKSNNWEELQRNTIKQKRKQRADFGRISDDCSQAFCMADSLLSNEMKFNPIDMRMRFLLWWYTGYCNGSKSEQSFGLGKNTYQGFKDFFPKCNPYVVDNVEIRGDINGNGSIMRLSPIPIAYHDDIKKAEEIAALSSLTTLNGDEAAELCRLLTHLVCKLINYEGKNPQKDIFDKLGETFQTHNEAVKAMAASKQETDFKQYDQEFNKTIQDRNWNWKNKQLEVSPYRSLFCNGYFGSYSMDCCKIALHIAYHSKDFKQAVFQAVNQGGDADSVAAVVGYICGAMYGISNDMVKLYHPIMVDHDDYQTVVKAMKLFNKKPIKTLARYIPSQNEPLL